MQQFHCNSQCCLAWDNSATWELKQCKQIWLSDTLDNQVQMYVCVQSHTSQGSLYYNVLITFKLHVSAFFHRAIIRLICKEIFSIQIWLRPIQYLVLRIKFRRTLAKVSLVDSVCGWSSHNAKRMVVPLFSGVLLAFSRVFLYWLMGVCRSVVLICISPLIIGRIMLFIRYVN
jgi:hypothetical protein